MPFQASDECRSLTFLSLEGIINLVSLLLALLRLLPESYSERIAYPPLHDSSAGLEFVPLCPYLDSSPILLVCKDTSIDMCLRQ